MSRKKILITGCSSGIGLDAATTLQKRGWNVLATCKQEKDCRALRNMGLTSFQLDLSCSKSIDNAIKIVEDICDGKLDALFNNGAFAIPGAIEDLPREALRKIFEVNVFGQFEVLSKCLPFIRANNGGRVITCSSVLGFTGLPFRGAYVGTKFALEGMIDCLRRESIDSDIKYILIEPGPIDTKIRYNSQKYYEKWIQKKNSRYNKIYTNVLEDRLYKKEHKSLFELQPASVTKRIIKALEAKKPKLRYYVTAPTFFSAVMKRLLSDKTQDLILKYRPNNFS